MPRLSRILSVFLAAASALTANVLAEEEETRELSRVQDGSLATDGEFPWHVRAGNNSNHVVVFVIDLRHIAGCHPRQGDRLRRGLLRGDDHQQEDRHHHRLMLQQ